MELELKHLAAYLPYELKLWDIFEKDQCILASLSADEMMLGRTGIGGLDVQWGNFTAFKPILRPMSDLINEINGVVPFEEIAKIEAPNIVGAEEKLKKVTAFKRGLSFSSSQIGVYYKYESVQVEITLFKDAIFHKKVVDGNDSWIFSYFHNYPAILDFLYENHFDVFGLIPAGLAIDINILES